MVNKSGQLLTELKKALEEDHKQREELIQEIKVGRRIKFNFLRLDLKPSNVAEHVLCFLSILQYILLHRAMFDLQSHL